MIIRKKKLIEKLVFLITFFSYSGYYAGLSFVVGTGNESLSRYYSIPLRIVLSALMVLVIINNRKNLNKFKYPVIFYCMVCFWVIYLFNAYANFGDITYMRSVTEYIFYGLSFCVLPFFCFCSLPLYKFNHLIMKAYILSGLFLSLISIYLYRSIFFSGLSRISAVQYHDPDFSFVSPLALSYSAALTMAVCVSCWLSEPLTKNYKRIIILSFLVSIPIFLLGASRGSVIALSSSFIIFYLYSGAQLRRKISLLFFVLLAMLIVGAEITGSGVFTRLFETKQAINEGGSSASRLDTWVEGFRLFWKSPVIGGSLEVQGTYPHNFVVECLMATGLIGFVLLMTIIVSGTKFGFSKKNMPLGLFSLAMLLQALVQYSFSGAIYTATLLFISLGMVYSFWNYESRTRIRK